MFDDWMGGGTYEEMEWLAALELTKMQSGEEESDLLSSRMHLTV